MGCRRGLSPAAIVVLTALVASCSSGAKVPDDGGDDLCEDVTLCVHQDGCCPGGCSVTEDIDCAPLCGDGVVEPPETCDGDCPPTCDDSIACTANIRTGSSAQCSVQCFFLPITMCTDGDGCCAVGCDATSDTDCSASCGNDVVEPSETCDGNCLATCASDGNDCTGDVLMGTPAQCNVTCEHPLVTACMDGDGCCAPGCNATDDDNCSASCGNGIVEAPDESCDGNCPPSCDDANACTSNLRTGTTGQCNVTCTYVAITTCTPGDGCCAPGCNANNDGDCAPVCGNGVVEAGETCDASCPASCDDGSACTSDTAGGMVALCTATCTHTLITTCASGDGCCPSGCTMGTDGDCCAPYELCNGVDDDCAGGVDDGCPSGVTIGATTPSPPYGGSGGNVFPERACAAGQVFVGFDGRAGSSVDRLAPACTTLTFASASGTPESSYAVGTSGSTLLAAAGGSGGSSFSDRCPSGQVVIGIYGHQSPEVERFGFICGALSVARTSPSGPWQITITRTVNSTLRGNDNSAAFEYVCPAGSVVTSFFGRAAERVDQIGVGCSPLGLQAL